ncbi:Inositol monophosphatase 1 [Lathyrus oleraceus]|uniref:Inositol monophosphatase 1 n=1 Tax=Pisum sativum TaxID=3888 RepID=A0A9D4YFU5_PEA|nr:Inositol monophosphatase 1 [Pisum sativum]
MSYRPTANSRTEVRRNRYKVAVDAEEGRRRREDTMVEIRKNRREESLLKKRREGLQPQQIPSSIHSVVEKKLENLPSMVTGVWSDDNNLQLEATTQFRKLLSIERTPPIEEVIQTGVVSRFVEFLMREDFPQLQFEAAWALTNIASGTSENTKVAVWALGNVAGDSPRCRDLVLGQGALVPLLAHLNEHAKLSMLRNATWTLSNFCRGKPQPPFDQVKPALPALAGLIHSNDEEVLTDACWALSYLSDGTNDKIQAVIEAGVCPRLVELLLHPSPSVLIPALRTVGNIVTGDDMQTQIQAVIEANIFRPLVTLLQNAEFDIKKEAAWAISNAISVNHRRKKQYRLVMVILVLGLQTQKLLALAMAMAGLMFQMPRASKDDNTSNVLPGTTTLSDMYIDISMNKGKGKAGDNLLNQVQLRRYLYDWQQNSQSSGHLDPSTEQFIQAKWLSGHEKKLSTAAEHPRALHPSLSFTDRT